jgi:hypothetical protein
MSQPSWLEPSNHLEELSRPPSQSSVTPLTLPPDDVQKVRCLWLISFIQDMRTFMGSLHRVGMPLSQSFNTAINLLQDKLPFSIETLSPRSNVDELENDMLTCLFSIGVILQELIPSSYDNILPITASSAVSSDILTRLELALSASQDEWSHSVRNLRCILTHMLMELCNGGDSKVNYVAELVEVLCTLSLEARQGVEKCLFNLFYSLREREEVAWIDDGWTPDSLLSSVHGY